MPLRKLTTAAYDRHRDYEMVRSWWRAAGVEPLPLDSMPRLGLWAVEGDARFAAAFAYQTTANFAILAYAVANPVDDWRQQAEALTFAVEKMASALRDHRPDIIMISLAHDQSMHHAYVKRAGFRDTGKVHIAASAPEGVDLDILTE